MINVAADSMACVSLGPSPEPVITGRGVGKTFGGGSIVALEGATFDVARGALL